MLEVSARIKHEQRAFRDPALVPPGLLWGEGQGFTGEPRSSGGAPWRQTELVPAEVKAQNEPQTAVGAGRDLRSARGGAARAVPGPLDAAALGLAAPI